PSGDHAGSSFAAFAAVCVSSRWPVPSAFMTEISSWPTLASTKAICLPSGDHVGSISFVASCVSCVAEPPPMPVTKISSSPSRSETKAIRLPFGETAGKKLFPPFVRSFRLPLGLRDQISMFRVVPRLLLWKTIVPFTPGNAPADEGRPATAASASGSRRASLELMSLPPAARIGPEAELGGELDVVVVIGGPPVEAAAVDGARLAVADGRVAAGDREPRVADGPAATQEAAGPLQDVLLRPPDGEPAVHRVGGLPEPVAPVPDEAVERAAHRLVRRRAPAPPGVVRPPRPAEGRADDRVVAVVGGPGTRAPRERRARDDDGQAFHPSPLLAGAQANATTAVGDATVGIPPHFARARGDRRTGCGARRADELRRRAAARPAGARPPRRGRRRQDDALRRGRPAGRRARRPHARRPAGRERRPVLLLRPRRPPRE